MNVHLATSIAGCSLTTPDPNAASFFVGLVNGLITPEKYVELITALNPLWHDVAVRVVAVCLGTPS